MFMPQYTVKVENRDAIAQALNADGIPTAIHYPLPLNQQPAVKDTNAVVPISEKLAQQVISLPMHPYLESEVQSNIVKRVLSASRG